MKGDLNGMVIGDRQTELNISKTADLLEFSHLNILGFTEYGLKKKKYPVIDGFLSKNALLMKISS